MPPIRTDTGISTETLGGQAGALFHSIAHELYLYIDDHAKGSRLSTRRQPEIQGIRSSEKRDSERLGLRLEDERRHARRR